MSISNANSFVFFSLTSSEVKMLVEGNEIWFLDEDSMKIILCTLTKGPDAEGVSVKGEIFLLFPVEGGSVVYI